jgi:hypothetical protein
MKYRTALALLVCMLGFAHVASAQAPDSWIQVSSPGEYFRVQMPHQPKEDTLATLKTNYGDVEIKGRSYEASADGANYRIWVLTRIDDPGVLRGDTDADLDACAEITWEGLLKPQRDRLRDDRRATAAMSYVKELAAKPLPGREYALTLGNLTGTTQCYSAESRVYVLLALNLIGATWQQEPFFQSFAVAQDVPGQLPIASTEPGTPGTRIRHPNDLTDEKVFRSSEVSTRARVLSKPEPSYTERAEGFPPPERSFCDASFQKMAR